MKKRVLNVIFISLILTLILVASVSAYCYDPNDPSRSDLGLSYSDCNMGGNVWSGSIPSTDQTTPTAQPNPQQPTSSLAQRLASNPGLVGFIGERLKVWESGTDGISGVTLKYLILFLVIILIYSALSYANFPDSFGAGGGGTFLRSLISIIVGILATFTITSQQILSILQSYTALGITLILFFPIMILLFFTLVTASKASPIGIYGQKILWLFYTLYLFIRSGGILLVQNSYTILGINLGTNGVVQFFVGNSIKLGAYDNTALMVMFVSSIFLFFLFVVGDKAVVAWFAKEKMEADLQAQQNLLQKSHLYDKVRAQQVDKT